ncbi:Bystin-domain-containing protein [Pavlovales sp. CCMP2436]|nr:Bystin-domain-containing protein [Pavlovales sp. CCMP2436]
MGRPQINGQRGASPARRAQSPARARKGGPASSKRAASDSAASAKRARRPSKGRGAEGEGEFDEYDELEEATVPEDLSVKIMKQARAQQEELELEGGCAGGGGPSAAAAAADDDDYDEREQDGWEEEVEEVEIDADDEALLARLMPAETGARRTLADVIMEKIAEHTAASEARRNGGDSSAPPPLPMPQVPDKVAQVYGSIGILLARYRSGKLPKAFKIVPKLTNWEEVLFLTQPQFWSPQACGAATRIFASALNPRMAQRFYALILLPATLDNIDETDKLNYHYYFALKKSIYKPAAFFKGIVLPMCEERCSLRQAAIVCSVLSKVSVPATHSAVTLLKLTEMPLSGAQMLFMRTLLMKKYALPYRVVDALAEYYSQFGDIDDQMPVVWHQSLLIFAQHYKMELTKEQKEELKPVLRKHLHEQITSEIRRELFNSSCRGDPYIPECDML